jgi:hypothetical protein
MSKFKFVDVGDGIAIVEFDGMKVVIGRDDHPAGFNDGAFRIDIMTHDCEPEDEHPGTRVPRIRLSINGSLEQIDKDGNWSEPQVYPPVTVLDRIVAAVAAADPEAVELAEKSS